MQARSGNRHQGQVLPRISLRYMRATSHAFCDSSALFSGKNSIVKCDFGSDSNVPDTGAVLTPESAILKFSPRPRVSLWVEHPPVRDRGLPPLSSKHLHMVNRLRDSHPARREHGGKHVAENR
jgi:hypothetical protein